METFPLGGLITLLVLLPNILVIFFPPKNALPALSPSDNRLLLIMTIFERIGQAGSFFLPFLYTIQINNALQITTLIFMIFTLLLYYAGWIRYLVHGQEESLFYQSMLGIPLPMAVLPVIYFLAASFLLGSPWLCFFALLLGIGHISVTRINAKQFIN